MKRELITTTLLVTLTHEKHVHNITDVVANRLSTIEGMRSEGVTVGIFRAIHGASYVIDDVQARMANEKHPAEALENMRTILIKGKYDLTHASETVSLEQDIRREFPVSGGCGCAPLGDGTDAKCPRADGTLLCDDPLPAIAGGVVAGGMSHLSVDEVPVVLRDGDSMLIDEMKLKPFVYRHQPDEL